MNYAKFVDKLMDHERLIVDPRVIHDILAINSEAGELANAYIKNVGYGQPLDKENVKEELGDLLFFIQDLCNIYGWTILQLIAENITKLEERYPDGEWTPKAAKDRADKEPPQKKGEPMDVEFQKLLDQIVKCKGLMEKI